MSATRLEDPSLALSVDNKDGAVVSAANSVETESTSLEPTTKPSVPLASTRKCITTENVGSNPSRHIPKDASAETVPSDTAVEDLDVDSRKRTNTAQTAGGRIGLRSDARGPWRLLSRGSWPSKRGKSGHASRVNSSPDQLGTFSTSDLSSSSNESSQEDGAFGQKQQKKQRERHEADGPGEPPKRDSSSEDYDRFNIGNERFKTSGRVSKRDGRLKSTVNETLNSGYLARALGAGLRHHLDLPNRSKHSKQQPRKEPCGSGAVSSLVSKTISGPFQTDEDLSSPMLNVVIMVIGSRGDIQPFLRIGKALKEQHGHRVRVATHPAFKNFVEQDSGLEFFSVGGDPSELMAFMVKNLGLIPSFETVRQGEIGRRRKAMYEMFNGMWRACIDSTDDTNKDKRRTLGDRIPFVADAIIANPPSFAHIHVAERLGIPLHMMFTFPYSPTTAFPHPLANIKKGKVDVNYTNFMSYPLVELMTW